MTFKNTLTRFSALILFAAKPDSTHSQYAYHYWLEVPNYHTCLGTLKKCDTFLVESAFVSTCDVVTIMEDMYRNSRDELNNESAIPALHNTTRSLTITAHAYNNTWWQSKLCMKCTWNYNAVIVKAVRLWKYTACTSAASYTWTAIVLSAPSL